MFSLRINLNTVYSKFVDIYIIMVQYVSDAYIAPNKKGLSFLALASKYIYLEEVIKIKNVNYHDMSLTFIPNTDIPLKYCNEWMSKVISKAMSFDEKLRIKHKKNTFKLYVFDLPRPFEREKIYFSGRAYVVRIRSFDLAFLLGIRNALKNEDCGVKIMSSNIVPVSYKPITTLITLSPIICTLNDKYWVKEDGILTLRDKIFSNACRKAKAIYKDFEEPEENFIEGIIQLNKIPVSTKYKGASLLGAKVEVTIKGDEKSQMLAYTVLGAGMLEKTV